MNFSGIFVKNCDNMFVRNITMTNLTNSKNGGCLLICKFCYYIVYYFFSLGLFLQGLYTKATQG